MACPWVEDTRVGWCGRGGGRHFLSFTPCPWGWWWGGLSLDLGGGGGPAIAAIWAETGRTHCMERALPAARGHLARGQRGHQWGGAVCRPPPVSGWC